MNHWLDLVAYAVVALCAVLAWRKLRPRKASAGASACGGCDGCGKGACKPGD